MALSSAYGGAQWSPRTMSRREEIAAVWGDWGVGSEYGTLRSVLLHRPGPELTEIEDYDAVQMRADVNAELARAQHDALAQTYRAHGVAVYYVEQTLPDKPNTMFVRDLMLMTPEGAIVTRPASTVRAGEERAVAAALARIGVPILMSVHGNGTFEGADVAWVDDDLCFLAEGLRTNREGADQVERMLREIGVKEVVRVGLAWGAMHLDGVLSLIDRDLAAIWPYRTPYAVVHKLRERGFRLIEIPPGSDDEAFHTLPLNGVALAPGKLLMPTPTPRFRELFECHGVEIVPVEIGELIKAGGGLHCMTGPLKRDPVA